MLVSFLECLSSEYKLAHHELTENADRGKDAKDDEKRLHCCEVPERIGVGFGVYPFSIIEPGRNVTTRPLRLKSLRAAWRMRPSHYTGLMDVKRLESNWTGLCERVAEAARRSGREPGDVLIVAVTKLRPAEEVRALVGLGVRGLGENYPQELWRKAEELSDLNVHWHLIGHLQTNKAKKTLPMVRFVHAVDSLKLLRTLNDLAETISLPPVCLQVNTSGEESKHGWTPREIMDDAEAFAACGRVTVVGLMTMAALGTDAETARPMFAALRRLRDELQTRMGRRLEHLSMGMSNDFEAAVEEGATLVRVGSLIFEGVSG